MGLCGTGIYANDVLCEVITKLDAFNVLALQLKDEALAALAALEADTLSAVAGITAIDYDGSAASGVNVSYSAPDEIPDISDFSGLGPTSPTLPAEPVVGDLAEVDTAPVVPAAYTVPAATTALISDSDIDDIFDRTAARLARIGTKEERDASYRASSMGIGMLTASLTKRLQRAEEGTNQKVSEAALEQSVQEGVWKREDVKTLHGLHIQNWPLHPRLELDTYKAEEGLEVEAYKVEQDAKTGGYRNIAAAQADVFRSEVQWALGYLGAESDRYRSFADKLRADLAGEAERRGWSEMELRSVLEQADKDTGYAIQKAQVTLETVRQSSEAVAQLMIGLTQGVFSAADYNLSGRGSQSVTESI